MVHDVAMRGFGREAEAYERSRPSYPPDAVAWLVDRLQVRPGAVVADLAAGTGKLTRLLLPTGAAVFAIEPVEGMRQVFHQLLPAVPIVAGTAEAMPIKSSSLDAVCAAQAFHWFDADKAFVELARVLRPGGRVGFAWNARDRTVDWVDRVWAIMDEVERKAPWRDHDNWRDSAFGERRDFGPLHSETFRHEHLTTPAGIVDRILGVSHVGALPLREQQEVLEKVRRLLEGHPDIRGRSELRVPYRVDCYWSERR
ncbi:MAG: class I SAM-dependent methyltransferase [Actinomycetota bacterium]|nr:class I SAM-dependent methyltransferase [Actinomycetota bacterium]